MQGTIVLNKTPKYKGKRGYLGLHPKPAVLFVLKQKVPKKFKAYEIFATSYACCMPRNPSHFAALHFRIAYHAQRQYNCTHLLRKNIICRIESFKENSPITHVF